MLAFLSGLPPLIWAGCDPLGQSVLPWGTVMAIKHQDSVSQRVRALLPSGWVKEQQQSRSWLMD